MKPHPQTSQLLDAVLAEKDDVALLESTLQAVRRRRKTQQWQRRACALVLVAGFILAISEMHWTEVLKTPPKLSPYRLVTSQPLAPPMWVTTRPNSVRMVASSVGGLTLVETKSSAVGVKEINDDQLFALLGNRPAMLVRETSDHSKLIMLQAQDQHGFPID
jgi:hypothetical protein